MTEQTKTRRLAEYLERDCQMNWPDYDNQMAAAELRRLDALNAELVGALDRLVKRDEVDGVAYTGDHPIAQAKATLAKAKEQT